MRLFGLVLVMFASVIAMFAAGAVARVSLASAEGKVQAVAASYLGTVWQRMRGDVSMASQISPIPGGSYLVTVWDPSAGSVLRCREYAVFKEVVAFRDTAPVAGSCPQPAGSWLDGYTGTTELVSLSGLLRLPKAVMCSLQEGGRVSALWVQDKLCAAMPWAPGATVLTVERDGREALVSWPVLWVRR
jgi:hypothetical protein